MKFGIKHINEEIQFFNGSVQIGVIRAYQGDGITATAYKVHLNGRLDEIYYNEVDAIDRVKGILTSYCYNIGISHVSFHNKRK